MSAYGVTDLSTGLPIFDLACAPLEAAKRFHFLKPQLDASSVRRLYHVFLATEIGVPVHLASDSFSLGTTVETTSIPVVVAISYDNLIVGDLRNGSIRHLVDLTKDHFLLINCEDVPSMTAVLTQTAAVGGDTLLSVPFTDDKTRFIEFLKVLVEHHRGHQLESHTESDLSQMKSKLYFQPPPKVSPDVVVSEQLWSVLSTSIEPSSDRLNQIKSQFKLLEDETKHSVASLHSFTERLVQSLEEENNSLLGKVEAVTHTLSQHYDFQCELEQQDARISDIKTETEVAIESRNDKTVLHSMEIQHWQAILADRQNEELASKRQLVSQQRNDRDQLATIVGANQEIRDRMRKIDEAVASYSSDQYVSACSCRDAALNHLEQATNELVHIQMVSPVSQQVRVARGISEHIETSETLRKLFSSVERDLKAETSSHVELRGDVKSFIQEIDVFSDRDAELVARANELHDCLESLRGKIRSVEQQSVDLEQSLEANAGKRPLFVIAKSRLENAVRRRSAVENTLHHQKKDRTERRTELQQRLFQVRLRVAKMRSYLE